MNNLSKLLCNEERMESLIPPFDAYKGNAPYIFVSYAHKNSDIVYSHITRLHNEGFRIWYDEGIDPGTDWSDEIASALVNAEVFLVFISDAAIASHNVRKEIVFAIDQKKPMVCVHVEEIELPDGLRMQLGNIQALLENRFHDKEKFYERLFNSLLPEKTRGEERDALPIQEVPMRRGGNAKGQPVGSKGKKILLGLVAGVLLVTLALGGYTQMQKSGNDTVFADKNLETALREEMQRPRGSVTAQDLASFKDRLNLSERNITNIEPLRHMKGIGILNLEKNQITDITPLGLLESVMVLGLGNNRISDLAPLQSCKRTLIGLSLSNNPIKDLKQLRPLSNLEILDISGVPITDLELGKYLRRLKSVILTDTGHGLDEEGLWQFKANLPPNCEVKMEKTNEKSQ